MKLISNYDYQLFGHYEFITNKYNILIKLSLYSASNQLSVSKREVELRDIERISVCLRSNYLVKNLNKELFFIKLPHFEEMKYFYKYFSDKKINYQIDRLLNLRAFE